MAAKLNFYWVWSNSNVLISEIISQGHPGAYCGLRKGCRNRIFRESVVVINKGSKVFRQGIICHEINGPEILPGDHLAAFKIQISNDVNVFSVGNICFKVQVTAQHPASAGNFGGDLEIFDPVP